MTNFTQIKVDDERPIEFLFLSDIESELHPGENPNHGVYTGEVLEEMLQEAICEGSYSHMAPPHFILSNGDEDSRFDKEYEYVWTELENLSPPCYHVLGNHESHRFNNDGNDWKRYFRYENTYYAWQYLLKDTGITFVVLDTWCTKEGDGTLKAHASSAQQAFREEEKEWLKKILDMAPSVVIVFAHAHLWMPNCRCQDNDAVDELIDVIKGTYEENAVHKHASVFFNGGHHHYPACNKVDGVYFIDPIAALYKGYARVVVDPVNGKMDYIGRFKEKSHRELDLTVYSKNPLPTLKDTSEFKKEHSFSIVDNNNNIGNIYNPGRQFQIETLDQPAYVEVHKSHGRMIGLVFHVGEFSLPILRSRPNQRIYNHYEQNPLRPWVMGRVTYKGKILIENPGIPGISLRGYNDRDNFLSAAVWINGERLDFEELSKTRKFSQETNNPYSYKEVVITAVPVLEQRIQIGNMETKTEIILSSNGPVQRTIIEVIEGHFAELSYCFISMFPKGVSEYYVCRKNRPQKGSFMLPSEGSSVAALSFPDARWLAIYNKNNQFGTIIYSPGFETENLSHMLLMDRLQDFKVYHMAGDYEYLTEEKINAQSAKLTVQSDHPMQLSLYIRPIETSPDEWKTEAEEKASQLIKEY